MIPNPSPEIKEKVETIYDLNNMTHFTMALQQI